MLQANRASRMSSVEANWDFGCYSVGYLKVLYVLKVGITPQHLMCILLDSSETDLQHSCLKL